MKKLSWFNKIVFFFNIVITVATVMAYFLPFLTPKWFPFLSVLTLGLPLLLLFNLLFFTYWFLQFKRHMILSGIALLLGITFINKLYKFPSDEKKISNKDFNVMCYNVRLFNQYNWIKDQDVPKNILDFVNNNNIDVLCLQEFTSTANIDFKLYPFQTNLLRGNNVKAGQVIYSKYPIIKEGELKFPDSRNYTIFADIKIGKDIIRFYNIHLQSIKISPDIKEIDNNIETLNQKKSEMLLKRISNAFKQQQEQAEIVINHKNSSPYPVVYCADMNNSAFSYIYKRLKGDMKDCFEDAGSGFGRTYGFKYYPARIDYILVDNTFEIKKFTNFPNFINSDHLPIIASLSIN